MENTNNKIEFINKKLNGIEAQIPHLLYKYRPFDEYTFDMLKKSYLYLCPAKNLDDKSECTVSFNIQDYADIDKRLVADLAQAAQVNTSKSLLDSKLNCVGNSVRKGVCHMLVNDDKIRWVEIDE